MSNLIPLNSYRYCVKDANGNIVSEWIRWVMLNGDDYWKEDWIEDSDFWQTPPTLAAWQTIDLCASCEDIDTTLKTVIWVNTSIPAWAKAVTINNTTWITTINGDFELGDRRRVDSISFWTGRGNCINEILPEYTLAWWRRQWIAHF